LPASADASLVNLCWVFEEYAVLRYCWTLRWLLPAHLTRHL